MRPAQCTILLTSPTKCRLAFDDVVASTMWDLNIEETWLMNNIMFHKFRYFGFVKRYSGLK